MKHWLVYEQDGKWIVGDLCTARTGRVFVFREQAERFCQRRNNPNQVFLRPW